ncbi:Spermidine N(1)-acetyltransferase [Psilocybe cubensis]|uniref:Spermidine N(1)-acetyltransferase n=2 Tax=Psilocybe cubensis TaxID=181762 RepID=A0ACB8HDN9_PSICU|nr:Spermidine N(1)-acetyltransferase [Psilocybe cubensis]KAH9485804.1 Spermidine N(1)-acetyltransferase [Psilocybe cubensis]
MFDLNCGIRLRPFRAQPAEDLENILSLYNNAQVAPLITLRFLAPRGERVKKEFLEIIDNDAEMFCIIETIPSANQSVGGTDSDTEKPQFVGITGLWGFMERGHRHTKYSIVLLPQFWNRGYGQQITRFMVDHAFIHMNMHRISLDVWGGNDRAIAVYKKQGFIEEGRQRKAIWSNGGWIDNIQMGMLVDDWKELVAGTKT